jgi:adenosylhomocysteine nucleosidase
MAEPEQPRDFAHADVGIVHATAIEVNPFLNRCERVRKYTGGNFTFRGGLLATIRIALAQSGIGPKHARGATQCLIDGHSPTWIISTGFSGALQTGMHVGDIVVASSIVDAGGTELTIDLKMPANPAGGLHVGRLLMLDRMVPTVVEKKSLGEQYAAIAVDMESLAVAQVCREAKTKFLAVRVISDDLSKDLPKDILSVVNNAGTVRWGAIAGAVFNRLGSVQDLWELRDQATSAAERLATFLDGVVVQLHGATP